MKSFAQLTEKTNNLMIVDSLNMAFSFRGKTKYKDAYLNMIESLKRSYKASKVVIACDKGTSTYRQKILPEYKQNRVEMRESQTDAERLEFEAFFQEFIAAIDIIKSQGDYPVLQFSGVEADDISAYICNRYAKNRHIWLISSDKDWDLLVGPNVSRFSYVTRKETTLDNWHEHYDYNPEDHISIKCLMGDTGDNILGVDKVGPARAKELVQKYGDTYEIIASLPIDSKYKYIQNLNAFGANNLLRNYRLMDLVSYCEEAIGEDNCKEIDKVIEEYLSV